MPAWPPRGAAGAPGVLSVWAPPTVASGCPRRLRIVVAGRGFGGLVSQEILDLAQATRDFSVDPTVPSSLASPGPFAFPLLPGAVAPVPDAPAAAEGDETTVEHPQRIPQRVGEQVRQRLPGISRIQGPPPPDADGLVTGVRHEAGYMPSCMYVSPWRAQVRGRWLSGSGRGRVLGQGPQARAAGDRPAPPATACAVSGVGSGAGAGYLVWGSWCRAQRSASSAIPARARAKQSRVSWNLSRPGLPGSRRATALSSDTR